MKCNISGLAGDRTIHAQTSGGAVQSVEIYSTESRKSAELSNPVLLKAGLFICAVNAALILYIRRFRSPRLQPAAIYGQPPESLIPARSFHGLAAGGVQEHDM